MANINAKGRRKYAPYIQLLNYIYDSDAFRDLSPNAVRIFLEMRRRYNGTNNGDISLSYREAASLCQCGNSAVQTALKQLQAHGLVIRVKGGVFTIRHASTWRLTMERYNDRMPTHEWKCYSTGNPLPIET